MVRVTSSIHIVWKVFRAPSCGVVSFRRWQHGAGEGRRQVFFAEFPKSERRVGGPAAGGCFGG
eukprot:8628206-Lingulodinium_polyedra.AAC.1